MKGHEQQLKEVNIEQRRETEKQKGKTKTYIKKAEIMSIIS